jgi:hypothetical protein
MIRDTMIRDTMIRFSVVDVRGTAEGPRVGLEGAEEWGSRVQCQAPSSSSSGAPPPTTSRVEPPDQEVRGSPWLSTGSSCVSRKIQCELAFTMAGRPQAAPAAPAAAVAAVAAAAAASQ